MPLPSPRAPSISATVVLAAGGVAVYVRDVEVGPAALLLLGAVFFLIGVSGKMPTRLKVGDNEAEWMTEVADVIQEAVSQQPPEVQRQVIDELERAQVPPAIINPIREAEAFENFVLRDIERAVQSIPEVEFVRETPAGAPDRISDALLLRKTDGAIIPILVKWFSRSIGSRNQLRNLYRHVGASKLVDQSLAVILLVNASGDAVPAAWDQSDTSKAPTLVRALTGIGDFEQIRDVIQTAVKIDASNGAPSIG